MPTSHIPKGNCGCVSGQSGVSLLLSLLTTKSLSLESPVLGVNKRSRSVHVDGDAQCLPLDITNFQGSLTWWHVPGLHCLSWLPE